MRPLGRGLGALVLLGMLAVPAARAAKLPDWAQAIADAAPACPDGTSEHASRVLLEETLLQVEPDGKLHIRRRRAEQALSQAADEIGIGWFPFDDRTRIVHSKAWHLPPEGATKKKGRRDAVDLTFSSSFLTDARTRVLGVSDVERGSLVFFEFEAEREPYQLGYREFFYEDVPALALRLAVELPDGWSLRHAWLRGEGPEPTISGNRTDWSVEQLEVPEEEPLGPSPLDMAPLLVLGFTPPAGVDVEAAALGDWKALAAWFEELAAGTDAVTPEVERAAAELFEGAGEDFFARVRSAGNYVRDRVRYVAQEIGVGGFRPRPAGSVLANLYGDCKDKATLLRALLAAGGQSSYTILIHNALGETVSEELPDLGAFNHVVVGVPLPQGTVPPPDFEAAIVDSAELGRLLVVDATDEYNSVGWLPASLAGKRALVVAGERSGLVSLPADEPGFHRIERRLEAEIRPDHGVSLQLETTRYGDPAAASRAAYRRSAHDYEDGLEQALLELWPASHLEGLEVEEESATGGFVQRLSVTIEPPRGSEPARLLSVFPGALFDLPRVSLRRREAPVQYPYPLTLRFDSAIRGLPPEVGLPEPSHDEGQGWAVSAEFEREKALLRAHWEMQLSRTRFDAEAFDELKEVWRAARHAAAFSVPREPAEGARSTRGGA